MNLTNSRKFIYAFWHNGMPHSLALLLIAALHDMRLIKWTIAAFPRYATYQVDHRGLSAICDLSFSCFYDFPSDFPPFPAQAVLVLVVLLSSVSLLLVFSISADNLKNGRTPRDISQRNLRKHFPKKFMQTFSKDIYKAVCTPSLLAGRPARK